MENITTRSLAWLLIAAGLIGMGIGWLLYCGIREQMHLQAVVQSEVGL